MTHREMIEKLGLTEKQYRELMKRFAEFCKSLDEDQKRVVRHNLPRMEQAARSLGPDVTVEDFKEFCGTEVSAMGMGCFAEDGGDEDDGNDDE